MTEKSTVAIVRTSAKTVLEDVARVCELGGLDRAFAGDGPVILKDNITWHLPFLSANTTPWQLEGAIRALKAAELGPLIAVHNDTVVTNPKDGLKQLKLQPVYQAYGIEQHFVNDPKDVRWTPWRPQAPTPWLDKVYPEGLAFPELFHGTYVFHLPTVKTHIYTTTTGAVKNSFGGLLNTKRHYCHSWIHGVLADLVAVQKELHRGMFAVADGTLAGNGPGPRTMQPVEKNLLIASADPVAMDAVAARLMGFDPWEIELFQECASRDLGAVDEKDIDLVGDEVDFGWGFEVGDNLASSVGDPLWFGAFKGLQYLMFRTPLVRFFVAGSHVYHDEYWWRRHGRRRMAKVATESQWGRLFASYRPQADGGA
ncbi:MAG: DUF362 domain-containing protein [Planctomycetota bacterium]|nr:MAG: DUF362 domain-containing protein [Planctomycetota bacterium]